MKVSILILTYNRIGLSSKCIPDAINKIGNIDAEILIWDNCSNDGTFDWLIEFSRSYDNVSIFNSDKNIGMEAINNLAEQASGEYIIKIDDDLLLPNNFAERLVKVAEQVDTSKILFISWDMIWKSGTTFATRSGTSHFDKIIPINDGILYISYDPKRFMVNGACRLSRRNKFLEIGGHPKGVIYGVDYSIAKVASKRKLWNAFWAPPDIVVHLGNNDDKNYRIFKDKQLAKHSCPRDV